MAKIADATFKGKTGSYNFQVYPIDTTFNPVAAVYIFTKRTVDSSGKGTHAFIYIGQTDSLADRIPKHEKWPCQGELGSGLAIIHSVLGNSIHKGLAMEYNMKQMFYCKT